MRLLLGVCTVYLCLLSTAWGRSDSSEPASFSYPRLSEVGSPLREERLGGLEVWKLDTELVARFAQLSNGERMLLQGWEVNGALQSTPTYTLQSVRGFYRSNGRFPANGYELASWNNGRGLGHLDWSTLNINDRLNWMAKGISPVSGTFFPSFTEDKWSRGGLFFQQFKSKTELDQFYADHPNQIRVGNWDRASEVWLMKTFGDTEGEVLLEVPIYFQTDESLSKMTPKSTS